MLQDNETPVEDNCVQFLFFKVDPSWRRLDAEVRACHKEEFITVLRRTEIEVETHTFSTLGLRADTDFMLWRMHTGLGMSRRDAKRPSWDRTRSVPGSQPRLLWSAEAVHVRKGED